MRLEEFEKRAIKEVIHRFDPHAKIYLFGSRTKDEARGGDIDLLVLSEKITEKDRRMIRVSILERIDDQKLDLIIAADLTQPFVRIAYTQGILL